MVFLLETNNHLEIVQRWIARCLVTIDLILYFYIFQDSRYLKIYTCVLNGLLVQKKKAIVDEEFVEAQRLKEMIAVLAAKKETLSEKQNGETKDVS